MKKLISKILFNLYLIINNHPNLEGTTSCITGTIGGWDLKDKNVN